MAWSFATGTSAAADAASIQPQLGTYSSGYLGICVCATYASDDLSIDQSWQTLYEATHLHIFYKTLGSSETNPTISGATNTVVANILTIGGHNGFGTETAVANTGTDATIECGTFSTNLNAELVIMAYGVGDNNSISNNTYGNLDGNTGAYDIGSNSGSDAKAGWIRGTLATAGSVGVPVATQAASDSWRSYVFTVKPAAAINYGAVAHNAKASIAVAAKAMNKTGATALNAKASTGLAANATYKRAVALNAKADIDVAAFRRLSVAITLNAKASISLNTRDEIYIERKEGAGSYARVKQDYWTNSPWTDTGPFNGGSTYTYKAKRFDPDTGWSSYSNEDPVYYPTTLYGAISLNAKASIAIATQTMNKTAAVAINAKASIAIVAQAMSKTGAIVLNAKASVSSLPCSVKHYGVASFSATGGVAALAEHTALVATAFNANASVAIAASSITTSAAVSLNANASVEAAGTVVGAGIIYGAIALSTKASIAASTSAMSIGAVVSTDANATVVVVATAMTISGAVALSVKASIANSASHKAKVATALNTTASIGAQASHKAIVALALNANASLTASATVVGGVTVYGAVTLSTKASTVLDTLDEIYIERKKDAGSYARLTQQPWDSSPYTDTGPFVYLSTYYYRAKHFDPTTGWSGYSNIDSVLYDVPVQYAVVVLNAKANIVAAGTVSEGTTKRASISLNAKASVSVVASAMTKTAAVALSVNASIGVSGGLVAGFRTGFGVLRFIGAVSLVPRVNLDAKARVTTLAKHYAKVSVALNTKASVAVTLAKYSYAAVSLNAKADIDSACKFIGYATTELSVNASVASAGQITGIEEGQVSLDTNASITVAASSHTVSVATNISAKANINVVSTLYTTVYAATSLSAKASVNAISGRIQYAAISPNAKASLGIAGKQYVKAAIELSAKASLVAKYGIGAEVSFGVKVSITATAAHRTGAVVAIGAKASVQGIIRLAPHYATVGLNVFASLHLFGEEIRPWIMLDIDRSTASFIIVMGKADLIQVDRDTELVLVDGRARMLGG